MPLRQDVCGTRSKFWFTPLDELPLNWSDERRSAEYRSTPPSLFTYCGIISDGRKRPSMQGKKREAGAAQGLAVGSASVGHTMAPIVPKKVLQECVVPLIHFVWFMAIVVVQLVLPARCTGFYCR